MALYLLVNICVVLIILAATSVRRLRLVQLVVLIIILLITAIGDSLIVGFGIVGYAPSKIMGVYVGNAPIEDFLYTVAVVIFVPALWRILGKYYDK